MRSVVLGLPMLAFIVSTRAALAAGIGLLLVPAVIAVRRNARRRSSNAVHHDRALVGAVRLPRKGDDDAW